IERLDPEQQLVGEETRALLWRDMGRHADERIDFHGFCAWVMRWKELSPVSVRNMYTSWAQEIAMIDFGLHESDGVFVVRADELPPSDVLKTEIAKLLRARRHANANAVADTPSATAGAGAAAVESSAAAAAASRASTERLARTSSRSVGGESIATSFLAGGAAGIVAKSILAPVDRVKIMFQVNDRRHFSFRNAYRLGREIYVQDGFRALFRGNMLNILRVVPYAGVQHSSFDFFRRQFHAYNFAHAEKRGRSEQIQKLSNLQLVTAGSLAGGLSLVTAYPLDIVRARYMVQQGKHQYQTIYEAVAAMYKSEGARSFSRGLLPSLLGTLPYTGIGFALNEKFKAFMLEIKYARLDDEAKADDVQPPRLHPFSKFVCSYFAACIAQTTTYPMDTIRRRIQTDGFVPGARSGEPRYTGVATTARIILAQEGWRGFFKGVSVNWMRSPLATGISLTTYDILKDVMGVEKVVMFGGAAAAAHGDGDGVSERPESRLLPAALLPQFSQWLQDVNGGRGVQRQSASGGDLLPPPPPPASGEEAAEFGDPAAEDAAAAALLPPPLTPLNRAPDAAANGDDQSAAEELHALLRRCHHSLPFVGLLIVYFAYQHTTGIVVFFVGTVAIMGLDQRMRAQVALKDKASELRLLGIVIMCAVDMFALCCVDGDPNPLRHFAWAFKRDAARGGVFWDVLWTVVVNDFLIRLWSVAAKAAVAVVKADRLRWLCASKFVADTFTFGYIFIKALILGSQGRRIVALVRSFVSLGLEFGAYVSHEDLVEAGSPDCSICYEEMSQPVKLPCSHMFCEECVTEWFDRERSCPLCRASMATSPRGAGSEGDAKPQFLDGSTSLFPQLF
ncbi:hypothetical protein PybrP1_010193, partial [[Pythium] brassicae (nom. inval.)]